MSFVVVIQFQPPAPHPVSADASLSPSAYLEVCPNRHVSLSTYAKLLQDRIRVQCDESLRNPTPAMVELMDNQKKRRKMASTPSGKRRGSSA
jgi:hypothetical protein